MRLNEINDETIVEVYNDYHSSVSYKLDRITRSWDIGTVKKIKVAELYEAVNMKGGRYLFEQNILLIKESAVREALGLKVLDKYDISQKEIVELLKSGDRETLEDLLAYCSETTLTKIVQKAIDLPIADMNKANLIKAYSGIDIVNVIKEKEEGQVATESKKTEDGEAAPPRRRRVIKE